MERRTWGCPVLCRCSTVPAQAWPGSHRGCSEHEAGGAHDLSPPGPHSTLDARPSAESPRCPRVPHRESPPAGQKTPDSGHVSQEPKSENSSTQSSPEMPTTKNRLGLGAHRAGSLWVVGSSFPSPPGPGAATPGRWGSLGTAARVWHTVVTGHPKPLPHGVMAP